MTMEAKKVMTRGRRSKNKERAKRKILVAKSGFEIWSVQIDKVKFIDCTACNIKRLEAIYTVLFEDLVIMFGKMVQRLVEPGASFFGDIGSSFDGDSGLMGKVVDDRSAPVEEFPLFLIFPPFDTPLSLQSLYRAATSKPIMSE
jgi:hypothetical protein